MNYKINITKTVPNPQYQESVNTMKDRNYREFGNGYTLPESDIVKDVLICELTEEQYKKVKAEIIKVFE